MTYYKSIVCLANSKKDYPLRCVAGIELVDDALRDWIRPVATAKGGALSLAQRGYSNGGDVALLDIVRIPLRKACPLNCQVENHLIDDSVRWEKQGTFDPGDLGAAAQIRPPLWIDGHDSRFGKNDAVPDNLATKPESSLALVAAKGAKFVVGDEWGKRRVRLQFSLQGSAYWLTVTDIALESEYRNRKLGEYPINGTAVACVSLAEPLNGVRYKLAASVLVVK